VKPIAALALFLLIITGFAAQAKAQSGGVAAYEQQSKLAFKQQQRQAKKAAKKQLKINRKAAKQQAKAYKKSQKEQKKHELKF